MKNEFPIAAGRATKKIFGWVAIGLASGLVIFSVGVYRFKWSGPIAHSVLGVARLPAASLGWYPLSVYDWQELSRAFDRYGSALHAANPNQVPIPEPNESARQALDKLIRDRALLALVKQHGLAVMQTDVDQAYTAQLAQGGNRIETSAAIEDLYGWSADHFKLYVLQSAVARAKLREQLSFDPELSRKAESDARRILGLVQAGEQPFAEIAKSHSQDEYANQGGDLGFVGPDTLGSEVSGALSDLAVGEVSQLVHTKFGFHIVKVEAEREVDGQRQVQVRQIFIAAPSVDALVNQYIQREKPRIFIFGFRWNAETGQVEHAR